MKDLLRIFEVTRGFNWRHMIWDFAPVETFQHLFCQSTIIDIGLVLGIGRQSKLLKLKLIGTKQ